MDKVIMISACLLGVDCRYNGGSKPVSGLREKLASYHLVAFCPEILGGLSIPRPPAEITGPGGQGVWEGKAKVINRNGRDCTDEFIKGAVATRDLVRKWNPVLIILKDHSPSCGVGEIYNGAFNRVLQAGDGVTVALLRSEGIPLITENDLAEKIDQILAEIADQ